MSGLFATATSVEGSLLLRRMFCHPTTSSSADAPPPRRSHRRHKNGKRETSVEDPNGTRLTTMPEEAEEEEDAGITIKVGGNHHPEGQPEQTLCDVLRRRPLRSGVSGLSSRLGIAPPHLCLSRSLSLSLSSRVFLAWSGNGAVDARPRRSAVRFLT